MSQDNNVDYDFEHATFESVIKDLEKLVDEIDNEELGLEAALKKYQMGMALVKFCQNKLTAIEQQVSILDEELGSLEHFDAQ